MISENYENKTPIIAHIDQDSFEWQAAEHDHPKYQGKAGIVTGDGRRILASSQLAKYTYGIKRWKGKLYFNEVKKAQLKCPDLIVHEKPFAFGKPDNSRIRHYSRLIREAVLKWMKDNTQDGNVVIEFTSPDEFFLDLTKEVRHRIIKAGDNHNLVTQSICSSKTNRICLEGKKRFHKDAMQYRMDNVYPVHPERTYQDELRLLYGAAMVKDLVEYITSSVGFKCSAGISHNKLLAKLACGLHKPKGITVLPMSGIERVSKLVSIQDVPGLGGDNFGSLLKDNNIWTMADLQHFPLHKLNKMLRYENCFHLKNLAFGMCQERVVDKLMSVTLSSGKTFPRVKSLSDLFRWFGPEFLAGEFCVKIKEEERFNHRRPTNVQIMINKKNIGTVAVTGDNKELIQNIANCLKKKKNDTLPKLVDITDIKLFAVEFTPVY